MQVDKVHGQNSVSRQIPPRDARDHRVEGIKDGWFGAAESAGVAHGDVLAPEAMGCLLVPLGGNQLTLAFKGDVYVYDFVPQEKVQAVLLLLGGHEVNSVVAPVQSCPVPSDRYSSFPYRAASLTRFREKRKERKFNRKVHQNVSGEVKWRLETIKDQITQSKSKSEDTTLGVTSSIAVQPGSVVEGCEQASSLCCPCEISAGSTPMICCEDNELTLGNAFGPPCLNKGTLEDVPVHVSMLTQDTIWKPNQRNQGDELNDEHLLLKHAFVPPHLTASEPNEANEGNETNEKYLFPANNRHLLQEHVHGPPQHTDSDPNEIEGDETNEHLLPAEVQMHKLVVEHDKTP